MKDNSMKDNSMKSLYSVSRREDLRPLRAEEVPAEGSPAYSLLQAIDQAHRLLDALSERTVGLAPVLDQTVALCSSAELLQAACQVCREAGAVEEYRIKRHRLRYQCDVRLHFDLIPAADGYVPSGSECAAWDAVTISRAGRPITTIARIADVSGLVNGRHDEGIGYQWLSFQHAWPTKRGQGKSAELIWIAQDKPFAVESVESAMWFSTRPTEAWAHEPRNPLCSVALWGSRQCLEGALSFVESLPLPDVNPQPGVANFRAEGARDATDMGEVPRESVALTCFLDAMGVAQYVEEPEGSDVLGHVCGNFSHDDLKKVSDASPAVTLYGVWSGANHGRDWIVSDLLLKGGREIGRLGMTAIESGLRANTATEAT